MSVDKISLAYWFPKLEATGVRVPKTEFWSTEADFWTFIEQEPNSDVIEFLDDLKSRARSWSYPLFLRTGHTSAKHSWEDSCYVTSEEGLPGAVYGLLEYSAMVMPSLPFQTWVIREFLDLDTRFTAFHGDMPINVEKRYFIEGGEILCSHPYWPPEAIEQTSNKPDDWRELLEEMNAEGENCVGQMLRPTIEVAEAFEGAWSLDWAKHKNGNWYAIDMAPMGVSYHWPDCPQSER